MLKTIKNIFISPKKLILLQITIYVEECNGQFQWDASHQNGKTHENKQQWIFSDAVEVPKIDPEEMERLARERFPSEFLSRNALNFEGQWQLNIRIAYDDDFHNQFGANAEARY